MVNNLKLLFLHQKISASHITFEDSYALTRF